MATYRQEYNIPDRIPLGQYLFHRLKQINITTIFGVPSEYNNPLLDQIYQVPFMQWCGNANQLNASYAADGYSRLKRLSCLITTFGVGEMSAVNGIAGSFAEHVAVLHIVGMPPSFIRFKQLLLHNTLGNTDYDVFYRLSNDICCYSTLVQDIENATQTIDYCIEECSKNQRPVYCGIPVNFSSQLVYSRGLDTPLRLEHDSGVNNVAEAANAILTKIYAAKHPIIVADACAMRHGCLVELRQLATQTNFPLCATPMGKTAFDEQGSRYVGIYMGTISTPQVREVIDFADFVLVVGALTTDFATSSFNFYYKPKNIVFLFDKYVKIGAGKTYPEAYIKHVLQQVLKGLDRSLLQYIYEEIPESTQLRVRPEPETPLRHEWVWARMSQWFRTGDIIITETGTSGLGINHVKFPSDSKIISQPLWGSVGYSVGACLGALMASQEQALEGGSLLDQRTILFVGDGALQLTVQEISTMIRWRLTPIIFVVNNKGYAIDRLLNHDKNRPNPMYYEIQQWDNLSIIPTFGAKDYYLRKVTNVGELDELLNDSQLASPNILKMVEIILPPMDGPQILIDRCAEEKNESVSPPLPKRSRHI